MLRKIELWMAAFAVATVCIGPVTALAGSSSLPPDVDLDPDRGMTFGRLPKTSFDRRVFDPMKKSLTSQAMDPSIDPYNPVIKSSRYEPGTGKIRDSLTDKVREMRRTEEQARKNRAALARRAEPSEIGKVRQPSSNSRRSVIGGTTKKDDD